VIASKRIRDRRRKVARPIVVVPIDDPAPEDLRRLVLRHVGLVTLLGFRR
jgi:hypothetical protein